VPQIFFLRKKQKQGHHYNKVKKTTTMKVFYTVAILAAAGLLHKGVCADKAKIADVAVSTCVCHFNNITLVCFATRQG